MKVKAQDLSAMVSLHAELLQGAAELDAVATDRELKGSDPKLPRAKAYAYRVAARALKAEILKAEEEG